MKGLRKLLASLVAGGMMLGSLGSVFATEAEPTVTEVDVTVRDSEADGVADSVVSIYVWSEEFNAFLLYSEGHVANNIGVANNIPVPIGTIFCAVAEDPDGGMHALSGQEYTNTWLAVDEDGIQHADYPDVAVQRLGVPYVHLYPGINTTGTCANFGGGPDGSGDLSGGGDDDGEVEATPDEEGDAAGEEDAAVDLSEFPSIELEVTVLDSNLDPVEVAEVLVYVTDFGLYSGPVETDENGRTDGLMIPVGWKFYAIAHDDDGNTYGGTYDYYFDRENYWISNNSETIENVATGLSRLPYLHLFPAVETVLPWGYEGGPEEFDPETYLCAGFPDAHYTDLTPEACDAIEYSFDIGVFTGTAEGLLEWNRPINRAEVTKVMIEFFERALLDDISGVKKFPDVADGQWYTNYVYSARHYEIVDGYPDGDFRPVNTINRVEMLRIFVEASDSDYSDIPTDYTFYHDVDVNEGTKWFIGYVNYAFFNGLIDNDGDLLPAEAMTRLDVIKLLYRASLL